MIECIKSCYAVPLEKFENEFKYFGDPLMISKGDKFEDYEITSECYSIKIGDSNFIFPQSNFINLSKVRDEKIDKILE